MLTKQQEDLLRDMMFNLDRRGEFPTSKELEPIKDIHPLLRLAAANYELHKEMLVTIIKNLSDEYSSIND